MKKSLLVILTVLIGVSFIFAIGPNYSEKRNFERGQNYKYHNEEIEELRDKIDNKFGDMLEENRDKIQKYRLEQQKIRIELKEEMLKDNPDWNNVSNLMDKQHNIGEKIYEIRKNQHLKILKSLTPEEREFVGHRFGMFGKFNRMGNFHRKGIRRPHRNR